MSDLSQKYRPRRFEDVAGQTSVIARLKFELAQANPRPTLLSGPLGTGKTTLGLIYARALMCQSLEGGEACNQCESCRDFVAGENHDFHSYACGERSKIEDVKEIVETAKRKAWSTKRRVFLLDEVSNLSPRAFDGLLSILENPPFSSAFILLTNKPDSIPRTVRSRLAHRELRPPTPEQSIRYLQRICEAEGIPYEADALALIQAEGKGEIRPMLRGLEDAQTLGKITPETVREAMRLDVIDSLRDYADNLVAGNLQKQLDIIYSWDEAPDRKREFLYRFFSAVFLAGVRRIHHRDVIMDRIPIETIEILCREMEAHARRLDLDVDTFWKSLVSKYEPRGQLTDFQMKMLVCSVDDLLRGPSVQPVRPNSDFRQKLRVIAGREDAAHNYSTWRQIKPLWESASFLPLQYGKLFNVRVSIYFGVDPAASDVVSKMTHQLAMRLSEWTSVAQGSPVDFHWIYRHETDDLGQIVTRVLMAIPEKHIADAKRWAAKFFERQKSRTKIDRYSFVHRRGTQRCLRFHWFSVRVLSRGLDPSVLARSPDGEREQLRALLKVPERLRQATGRSVCQQTRGSSESLGPRTRAQAMNGFINCLSALDDRAWSSIDTGWELQEFHDRLTERDRRSKIYEAIDAKYSTVDPLEAALRTERRQVQQATFSDDPHQMIRSWVGWWGSNKTA